MRFPPPAKAGWFPTHNSYEMVSDRYRRIGEGQYQEIEAAIQALLSEH